MSKVVHIRLSDETLYTCLKGLENSNIDTTNLSLGKIVKRFLEGVTLSYREQTHLDVPENAQFVISQIVDDTPLPIVMPEVSVIERPSGDAYDPEKMENIRKAMETKIEQDIPPDVEIHESVEDEPKELPPEPWLADGVKSFEEIQKAAPKDVLVEKAKDDPILQRAVQCVYSELPEHSWGSAHTIGLVDKVVPTIQLYFN